MRVFLYKISQPTLLTLTVICGLSAQQLSAETLELDTLNVVGNTVTPETNSVNADQIEKIQANDLQDLFSQSPEVSVGGGPDVAQKLYIRGIEDQLLNITIDGAQQSTRQYHHAGRISIEPELLKRVEVNAGAGNALSGPGALGGSIKFITKDPEDMLQPGQKFGGFIKGTFSSNTDSFKINTSLFGRMTDDWSAMVSYTRNDTDNYEDGKDKDVLGTEFDQDYVFAKVVGHMTDSQTLRLSYEKRQDEGERARRPQWVVSEANPLFPIDIQRKTVTLNYDLNPIDNSYIDMALTLYHTETELFQDGAFGPYYGKGKTKGFDLRNSSILRMHTFTYGVDYREDKTTAGGEAYSDNSAFEDKSEVKGVYIQDDIQITEALMLSAGLRYDDYELDAQIGNSHFDEDDVSGNIGVNYHFTDSFSAFASYAEAFKGPQAQDAFKIDFVANSPDLKPEKAKNIEFGIAYDSKAWFGSAKVYRSRIEDVVADPAGGPRLFENVGDLKSDGVIVELGRRSESLLAKVSYHHNEADVDGIDANAYDHNGIANTVRDTLLTQLDYQLDAQWSLGWNAQFVKGRDNVQFSEGKVDKPGYGVHDLYAQWVPSEFHDVRITMTVRNVFDKNYIDQASVADYTGIPGYGIVRGYNEPGRDVRLSLAWHF